MITGIVIIGLVASGCDPRDTGPAPVAVPPSVIAIVGVGEADPANYPYYVHIGGSLVNGTWTTPPTCGGSIIASTWVLTAASCVQGKSEERVTSGTRSVAGQVTANPDYSGDPHEGFDLALIRVDATLTAGITPIQVGAPLNATKYRAGTPAKIMGTGNSTTFRVADTVLHSDDYMDDIFNPVFGADHWAERLMIGAGGPDATTCYGDRGGPLVVDHDTGRPIQVGVASFGKGNCDNSNAFAELEGIQVAWLAKLVPPIITGWGACTTVSGAVGNYRVRYGPNQLIDGPQGYPSADTFWDLKCIGITARMMQARHSGGCVSLWTGFFLLWFRHTAQCTDYYGRFELVPSEAGHYHIVVSATGKCMGVSGARTTPRTLVDSQECGKGQHQQWRLQPAGGGYYAIIARHIGQCLDIEGDKTGDAQVWQYPCEGPTGGPNQQFRFMEPPPCPECAPPPIGNKG